MSGTSSKNGKWKSPAPRAREGARHDKGAGIIAAAWLALFAAAPLALTGPAQAGGMLEARQAGIAVGIDQARAVRLPAPADLVAVGNPSIADAIIQDRDLLLLVGRSFGATNILVFGPDGQEIARYVVDVVDASPHLVTLSRGASRLSYNCAPVCERTLKVGDDPEAVKTIAEGIGREQGLATQGAEATAAGQAD